MISEDASSGRHDGASSVRKVSHTLSPALADRLELFGFREKISESAVIEAALLALFGGSEDRELGIRLREMGCRRRRRVPVKTPA